MNDEQDQQVGFFRELWAVDRELLRSLAKLLNGARRLFAFGARRVRDSSADAPDSSGPTSRKPGGSDNPVC